MAQLVVVENVADLMREHAAGRDDLPRRFVAVVGSNHSVPFTAVIFCACDTAPLLRIIARRVGYPSVQAIGALIILPSVFTSDDFPKGVKGFQISTLHRAVEQVIA